MRLKITTIALLSFIALGIDAQEVNIIPQPVSMKQPRIAAQFNITPATVIVLEGSGMENSVGFFN